MQCDEVKTLLPIFLDDELTPEERTNIQVHLSSCGNCQNELKVYRRSWDLLKQWPDLEPPGSYISQFWSNVSAQTPWYTSIIKELRSRFFNPRVAPVWVIAFLLLFISAFVVQYYWQIQETEVILTSLPFEEIELIDNIDLVENYEVIQNLDTLEEIEILEDWTNENS